MKSIVVTAAVVCMFGGGGDLKNSHYRNLG